MDIEEIIEGLKIEAEISESFNFQDSAKIMRCAAQQLEAKDREIERIKDSESYSVWHPINTDIELLREENQQLKEENQELILLSKVIGSNDELEKIIKRNKELEKYPKVLAEFANTNNNCANHFIRLLTKDKV